MSAVLAAPVAPDRAVVPTLAGHETLRLLRHPVMLLGFAFWLTFTYDTFFRSPRVLDAFEQIGTSLSWAPGVLAILAAYLVTTRDRRAGSLDVLDGTPARAEERVRALCLASLGPGLVGLVLNVVCWVVLEQQGKFVEAPGAGHLLQAPLTLVGACLLGVMLGVWAPSPITPALAIVAMVALQVAVEGKENGALFGPAVFWADWGGGDGTVWFGLVDGSVWWHLLYVAGLCGMAAAAAVVRVAEQRRTTVALGLVSVAATALGAVLQLP